MSFLLCILYITKINDFHNSQYYVDRALDYSVFELWCWSLMNLNIIILIYSVMWELFWIQHRRLCKKLWNVVSSLTLFVRIGFCNLCVFIYGEQIKTTIEFDIIPSEHRTLDDFDRTCVCYVRKVVSLLTLTALAD